jgi:hypothetical protein
MEYSDSQPMFRKNISHPSSRSKSKPSREQALCRAYNFFVVEPPFYLQDVYIHSAKWCED